MEVPKYYSFPNKQEKNRNLVEDIKTNLPLFVTTYALEKNGDCYGIRCGVRVFGKIQLFFQQFVPFFRGRCT